MKCSFCDESGIKERTFLESKNFRAIYNKYPLVEGHCLVIPKRHVESLFDLTQEELKEVFDILKKTTRVILKTYNLDSFNWVLNIGKVAGQRVKHIHFHILPRREGDLGEDPRNFFIRLTEKERMGNMKEISGNELKKIIQKIKKNIT